ncbi:CPBP family glutamic-type intramembrane protease [Aquimarina rhabdastrellae]
MNNETNYNVLALKSKNLITQYFKLFGLYFLFGIFLVFFKSKFPDLDFEQYSQDDIIALFANNKLKAFFSLVIIAPLIEEGLFRTLIKPKSYEIPLFLASITGVLLLFLLPSSIDWYYRFSIMLFAILASSYGYSQLIPFGLIQKIRLFLYRNQIIVLQITSVLFGLIHILNYVDTFQINTVLFLLIVPRIFAGHMCGMIKIKNDHLIWSILLHAINNGVVFISLLIMKP